MTLRTRNPSGEAGHPNLLIEGKEKVGKTYAALRFTSDPRVGRCFVIEVGERRADEYAALGDFEVVEHDGSLHEIVEAIKEVMRIAPEDGRPNVLVVDSMTGLWDLVKRKAEEIARSSKAAQEILERDPHAVIDVKHQAWNKAKDPYWWGWLNQLRAWPGIALLTCRADEVSKFVDGRPVAGQTEYRVEMESGTVFILDGAVRIRGPQHPPLVTAAGSLNFTVPDGGLEIEDPDPLAHVIFGLFGAGTEVTLTVAQAKDAVMAKARSLNLLGDEAVAAAREAWKVAGNRTRFGPDAMKELLAAVVEPEQPEDTSSDASPDASSAELGADPSLPLEHEGETA